MDDIETAMVEAFDAAERAGKCPRDRYLAALRIWRGRHPDTLPPRPVQATMRVVIAQQRRRFSRERDASGATVG